VAEARTPLTSVYAPPAAERGWRLEEFYPGAVIRFYSFGRRALAAGLEVLGARGQPVLLPEFVCRDLLSSLDAAGARAVYYPVRRDLRPATPPDRWPQACAALAVDYFGFPQDLEPFRAYAERTGATLIEDNAHGLFSRDEAGAALGLRADLGLFSLRKTLLLPNGAALMVPEDGTLTVPEQSAFSDDPTGRSRGKQALRAVARRFGPRAALRGLELLRGMRGVLKGSRIPLPAADAERVLPEPALPCRELEEPLRAGSPYAEVARRRELYSLVDAQARRAGAEPVFERLPENAAPYGYPFRARPERLPAVLSALAELGLEPLTWPDLPDALAASAPEYYRDVRLVHFLW